MNICRTTLPPLLPFSSSTSSLIIIKIQHLASSITKHQGTEPTQTRVGKVLSTSGKVPAGASTWACCLGFTIWGVVLKVYARPPPPDTPCVLDTQGRAGTVPGLAFAVFHMCFAMLAPAIMTGAFAERMRFPAFCLFIVCWIMAVYCPFAHWLWSPAGFLYKWGARDFAGGAVVHISAGSAALASLFMVGSRRYENEENRQILQEPHDRTLAALGTALLWFGWLGFNGGAAMSSGGQFVFAVTNTIMAASVSMVCWIILEWFHTGMPSIVGACMGVIAGMSAITAAAGFVMPWAAMLIGMLGSCACYGSVWLIKERMR